MSQIRIAPFNYWVLSSEGEAQYWNRVKSVYILKLAVRGESGLSSELLPASLSRYPQTNLQNRQIVVISVVRRFCFFLYPYFDARVGTLAAACAGNLRRFVVT
jgi:hypothetical protein